MIPFDASPELRRNLKGREGKSIARSALPHPNHRALLHSAHVQHGVHHFPSPAGRLFPRWRSDLSSKMDKHFEVGFSRLPPTHFLAAH